MDARRIAAAAATPALLTFVVVAAAPAEAAQSVHIEAVTMFEAPSTSTSDLAACGSGSVEGGILDAYDDTLRP